MSGPRFLRPAHLQVVGAELWAVDDVQPVAARLDAASGELLGLVGWPSLPMASQPGAAEWRALSGGDALWVQAAGGPVARVAPDVRVVVGTVRIADHGWHEEPWQLAAAGPSGAWLTRPYRPEPLRASADDLPQDRDGDALLVVSPDGLATEVFVDAVVVDLLGDDVGLHLQVETGGRLVPAGGQEGWEWEPELEWLTVRWTAGPGPISRHRHTSPGPRSVPSSRLPGQEVRHFRHPSTAAEPSEVGPHSTEPAAGLLWQVGMAHYGREVLATATDGVRQVARWGLGPGRVRAVVGTAEALFCAVSAGPRGTGAAVLRVTADGVTAVLGVDTVDVTAHRRALGDPPADADSYARSWLARLTADGREDVRLVGGWPEQRIEVTAARPAAPAGWYGSPGGGTVVHQHDLYDELGRPTPPYGLGGAARPPDPPQR